jgi:hypothetical protein
VIIAVPEKIFGKVETCPPKPPGAGKLGEIIDHGIIVLGTFDIGKLPHGGPKFRDMVD